MDKDFEAKKRYLLTPLYVEAGAALFDCQVFEYGIALMLHHFARLGLTDLEPRQTTAIMEDEEKKTAGQLMRMVKIHFEVSNSMEEKLSLALNARNKLVHRILIDNAEKIPNHETRKQLIKEIRNSRSIIREADKSVRKIVDALGNAIDGFDPGDYLDKVKGTIS